MNLDDIIKMMPHSFNTKFLRDKARENGVRAPKKLIGILSSKGYSYYNGKWHNLNLSKSERGLNDL